MKVAVDFKLKEFKDKENQKHYKLSSFNYEFEPIERFDIKFQNLFNGNKEKGEYFIYFNVYKA